MNEAGRYRRKVVVANPSGLHMRPAAAFQQLASRFSSSITVSNGTNRANGKSAMELILLVALPGTELTVEVEGEDAAAALDPLVAVLADPGEGYG
ncbi:MAG TPA: HPr family phosphocarrier protein [Fimbriiglobus sp.]